MCKILEIKMNNSKVMAFVAFCLLIGLGVSLMNSGEDTIPEVTDTDVLEIDAVVLPPDCLVPAPADGTLGDGTCSDAKIECHWVVKYCEEWFDYPTDCMTLGPADPDINYGTVTWENYYCGCDMKCHPKGECKNGKSDMIQQKCSAKYGWGECPDGAFQCYWQDKNDSNVHCPIPKCCGGWCDIWDPC